MHLNSKWLERTCDLQVLILSQMQIIIFIAPPVVCMKICLAND